MVGRSRPPEPVELGQRDLDHRLGLGPRDQHAAVDHEVERPEPPSPEHVLQRLAGAPSRHHVVEVRHARARTAWSSSTRTSSPATAPAASLDDAAGLALGRLDAGGPEPLDRLVQQLAPADRAVRALGHGQDPIVGEPARPFVGHERVAHLVELAGEHPVEVVDGEPDPVVGDPVLLEVVGADLLAAAAAADLGLALAGRLGRLPQSCSSVQQPGAQDLHRLRPVLDLALLVLHRHDQPGRQVGDAHRRVGRVDRLTARARRPVHVDLQVVRVDVRRRPRRPRAARRRWRTRCGSGPGTR